jgi:hypothetical protein
LPEFGTCGFREPESPALVARAPAKILPHVRALDVLVTHPVTGRITGLTKTVRRALRALRAAKVPHCVIGATALAVRGLPRMTRDLDVVVMIEGAADAVAALRGAGLRAATPIGTRAEPESMIVFVDPSTDVDIDLLVAAGDPEATVCAQAAVAKVFGVRAPVASLEHLLLLYLYSNQPKHFADFAAIVISKKADLRAAERALVEMHPEMVAEWRRRVRAAQSPPPAPKRPPPRRRPR